MTQIIGGIGTTHVPSIGKAIADGKQNDPYWSPFFRGFEYVHGWLARERPDVAVVFSNDHGLNFFLDKLPTFAVGAASEYRNEDEGWGIPVSKSAAGDADLSWHLINQLVADGFDMTICQEMLIDHAVTIPMALMWPGEGAWPVKIVPISINTVQHPLPHSLDASILGAVSAARLMLTTRKSRWWWSAPAAYRINSMANERASSTRSSTYSVWTNSCTIPQC
jgi:protocatechuate 4,5-dioxygenase, beta chain